METKSYELKVSGELDENWKVYFAPFIYSRSCAGETIFIGSFRDQAELIQALNRFQSVNVPILSITILEGGQEWTGNP
jgi:hypothetical protein